MIKGSNATASLRVVFPAKNSTTNKPVIRKCSARKPMQAAVSNKNSTVMTMTGNASLAEGKIDFLIIASLIVYSNVQYAQMPSNWQELLSQPWGQSIST